MTVGKLKKKLEELRVPDEAEICSLDGSLGTFLVQSISIHPLMQEDDLGNNIGTHGAIVLS